MKKYLSNLIIASIALPIAGQAAITVGNTSSLADVTTNQSVNYTLLDSSSTLLAVSFATEGNGGVSITDVQWGGVSLTPGTRFTNGNASQEFREIAQVWYLLNPDTSNLTQTLSITLGNTTNLDGWNIGIADFAGVDSFVDEDGLSSTPHASSFQLSFDTSSVAGQEVLLFGTGHVNDSATVSADTGVEVYTSTASGTDYTGAAYYSIIGSAGDPTTWDWTVGNNDHAAAGLAFVAVPEPSTYALLVGFAVLGLAVIRRRR